MARNRTSKRLGSGRNKKKNRVHASRSGRSRDQEIGYRRLTQEEIESAQASITGGEDLEMEDLEEDRTIGIER